MTKLIFLSFLYVYSQSPALSSTQTLSAPPRKLQPAHYSQLSDRKPGSISAMWLQLLFWETDRLPSPPTYSSTTPPSITHQVAFDVKMKGSAHLVVCFALQAALPWHQSLWPSHWSKLKAGLPSSCCNKFWYIEFIPPTCSAMLQEVVMGPTK